jgi:hypothetical protein
MAWTFCTKSDVVEMHPCQEADLQDSWSDMVEDLIRQHMGQPYLGDSQVILDEYHSGTGLKVLLVNKSPILTVESVVIGNVTLAATDYTCSDDAIVLFSRTFTEGWMNVKISYTSGTSTVDNVTRLAATAMIVAVLNYRKRYGADSSMKWAQFTEQKAGEETANANFGLTTHLNGIMRQVLRRPSVRVR